MENVILVTLTPTLSREISGLENRSTSISTVILRKTGVQYNAQLGARCKSAVVQNSRCTKVQ